jgi:hypothetical protein
MNVYRTMGIRITILLLFIASLTILSTRLRADTGTCGGVTVTLPFNDVMASPFFCQIAAAYFSGLTNGTTATTYSPTQTVTREQMAAFTTRTLNQSLTRGSRRAALNQWWTSAPQYQTGLGILSVNTSGGIQSDGADLWVPGGGIVSRVRASDGKVLGTWTGADGGFAVLVAMGRVFLSGSENLYMIDPTQPPGAVTIVATNIDILARSIAFDGSKIWIASLGGDGSVSIVTPAATLPWTVTRVTTGLLGPTGIIYDGVNIWAADQDNLLKKLDSNGNVIQSVAIGGNPGQPVFDGTNIWVPHGENTVSVVRAATGTVVATVTGNGLHNPNAAAFDGERIMVTNQNGDSVSLWKATDLTPIGSFPIAFTPKAVCSDGLNFWITLNTPNKLARF